ncbi:MAG: excinuclease ABC subunit B [Acidobacteria bacterium]|nr:MAG: excinuclease ABC subunit B [Acidobacteriota bacterium]
MKFKLHSNYQPRGDQPAAIDQLYRGLEAGEKQQVLLGVTGSGKTFTMAKLIEHADRPALVLAHNKTLAAQLYHEFKGFFPENAVEYFVSYYDFYQPEAYVPSADIYIDKEATINDELDKLRMSATRSLFERRDVVIVASVSCIYGLGSPEAYYGMLVMLEKGQQTSREALLRRLVDIQYERSEDLRRGTFRVRGDMIEIYPTYEDQGYRIEMWGDQIDALRQIDPLTGEVRAGQEDLSRVPIYPKTHYVMPQEQRDRAIVSIQEELWWWKKEMEKQGKFVEAQRVVQRTMFDIEMMRTIGYCHGIENYSRHLSGRLPGEAPPTLLDYVPQDYLMFIDESHQTVGQVRGMFNGDRARKQTLVDYGFRMPSALDNRPLTFEEFEHRINQVVYVSATPGPYELTKAGGVVVEQVSYLHSEVETLDRIKILRDLRRGEFDVLIGINLLREGLDLPEVSLVAILDADKEGFLRSTTSLIQTIGRCARHIEGRAILYADRRTDSMNQAIDETNRRRAKQVAYNKENNITPMSIIKSVDMELARIVEADYVTVPVDDASLDAATANIKSEQQLAEMLQQLETQMRAAAKKFEFEKAAQLRDRIRSLKQKDLAGLFSVEATPAPATAERNSESSQA